MIVSAVPQSDSVILASGEGSEIVSKQDEFVKEIQAQAADAAEWDSFDDDGIQW